MRPEFTPRHILWLLGPTWWSVRNRRRNAGKWDWLRLSLVAAVSLVFSLGVFWAFYRVLVYIGSFSEFTAPLTHQILATVVTFLLTVLFASNVVTALATQFMSEDLTLLVSAPVPLPALYGARLVLTIVQSSWMVLIFGLPIFAAFAWTVPTALRFGVGCLVVLPPLVVIPAAAGGMTTSLLLSVFPARRVREILLLVGALFMGLLVFLIRIQQPERLLRTRAIYDVAEFFSAFRTPSSPFLPSTWATAVLTGLRRGEPWPTLETGLLWATAASAVILGCWTARGLYQRAYTRSQESRPARFSAIPLIDRWLDETTRPFELRLRSLLLKDVKTFVRDTTQWSQLLLLLALVVVYLYNFSVLPSNFTFATFYLQNLFSFLNLGLAGFVLAAVAVRFVFTSVSGEGQAFWIIRSSPLPLSRFLWSKFWTTLPPLLILSQILTWVSNYYLGATGFMTVLASLTILCVTAGIVGLGVGMGAMFPRFKFENVTQIAGSWGGLLYMMATSSFIALVLLLEALPVYLYMLARHEGTPLGGTFYLVTSGSLAAVLTLNVVVVWLPMRWGERRLRSMDWG